jgi:hypothetical protein
MHLVAAFFLAGLNREWAGRHYCRVDHRSHHPEYEAWLYGRLIFVDENGYVFRG